MNNQPDVIVVGGGIGGLSAAFALVRAGLRVRVLERSAEFGEVGAGIQIAPNCTRILDAYELLGEAKKLGVLPDAMVMKDALDGSELTRLDLKDMARRYGSPYMVIHRSDLHGLFLRACRDAGVELLTSQHVLEYENTDIGARAWLMDGGLHEGTLVVAADGLRSVARKQFVGDEPVNSAYVAYRGAVPIDLVRDNDVSETDVVVYIGPRCHFVQYPLRGGEMFNQVAVFESAKARAGEEDWGTPDELDAAFAHTCANIQKGLPLMWRDRWWRMFDRDPISTWVYGRIALLGDAAHPPLQYIAQGAIMAIEDGYVLAEHLAGADSVDAALAAYEAVRAEHCRRVLATSRAWGDLWHLDGDKRLRRNAILRARDTYDYSFIDWLYSTTALTPDQEPLLFTPIPLDVPKPGRKTEHQPRSGDLIPSQIPSQAAPLADTQPLAQPGRAATRPADLPERPQPVAASGRGCAVRVSGRDRTRRNPPPGPVSHRAELGLGAAQLRGVEVRPGAGSENAMEAPREVTSVGDDHRPWRPGSRHGRRSLGVK